MKHLVRALLKVVHRVAQIGPLRVVDVDHVRGGSNRQRFRIHAVVVVAADINLFACRRDRILVRLILHGLCFVKHLVRALLKVVHRVAQVGLLREYRFEHRLLIQTIRLIQKRSGLCIRQRRTRAFNRLFGRNPDPVVKLISVFRVGRYGRQLITDDRTVFSHNLARHNLHKLRNALDSGAAPKRAVTVRYINNICFLFRVRHPLRGIRRVSLHRLRNLRSPAIKLPAGLAVLISRKSGSRIVIFCGVFLFRKGIGSMVALLILDRKGVLFIVENDLVRSLDDRDRLRGFRYQFIAFNIRCFLCHQFVKRLILHSLCIEKLLARVLLKVLHRVAQVGNPIVEDFYFRRDVIKSMGFSQIRIVRRNLILFSIFCDGFGNVLVSRSICSGCPFSAFYIHAIFDLFPGSSILKDKLVRGLNSLNFDKDVQVPCGDSIAYIVIRTITGLKTTIIPVKPRLGILYRDIQIVPMMEVSTCNKRYRISRGSITTGFALVIIRVTSAYPWRRHIHVINISNRIPAAVVGLHVARLYAFNLCININLVRYDRMHCRNLLLIPAAGNPIRQRPHRHQIDEHQRRHQNGYKAFYFIPHCLILLFHLEAALPMLPERSKRICGQTVRRLKKRFGKNGRVIPARRFPPPRRALRVQPPPRARQPPRVRRLQASARSGQRGDSSN